MPDAHAESPRSSSFRRRCSACGSRWRLRRAWPSATSPPRESSSRERRTWWPFSMRTRCATCFAWWMPTKRTGCTSRTLTRCSRPRSPPRARASSTTRSTPIRGSARRCARSRGAANAAASSASASGCWPWPLQIATLGRFELRRDGEPIGLHGKAQKKPLELLKALIAGGGRAVDKARLADFLWPDADGDAAALEMTISRLRKLLGRAETLRSEDGKLGLDSERVWIDVWSFDRAVDELHVALHGEPDEAQIAGLVDTLVTLYRGAFLDTESPQRWMLAARNRWQNRFLRSLADSGRWWERGERWAEAIALYERGIEADTLAEELYRRLMHCHLALGQHADAARVYRRCREMLSVQLGIVPSAETEALFRSIYGR